MEGSTNHIIQLEEKLNALIGKTRSFRKENEKLRRELEETSRENDALKLAMEKMKLQVDLLKTSQPEDAKMARSAIEKKINDYIREIDRCIALLGDES